MAGKYKAKEKEKERKERGLSSSSSSSTVFVSFFFFSLIVFFSCYHSPPYFSLSPNKAKKWQNLKEREKKEKLRFILISSFPPSLASHFPKQREAQERKRQEIEEV